MKETILAAGVQLVPQVDIEDNLKKAAEFTRMAAEKGARLVCLPELFTTPWFPSEINVEHKALAEAEDGPAVTAMRELSKELGIVLIAPIFEVDPHNDKGETRFNTAFVLGPEGELIGRYRKVHVPALPLWEERTYFSGGDLGFPIFETPFAKVGVLLGWDAFFPEAFRELALGGAEVVFLPTGSAFAHSRAKWERAAAASAHANGLYVFRVNRVGKESDLEFYGGSFCAGPDGEFAVKPAGSAEGVVLAECDPAVISTVRKEWVFLRDRRPECYTKVGKAE